MQAQRVRNVCTRAKRTQYTCAKFTRVNVVVLCKLWGVLTVRNVHDVLNVANVHVSVYSI